MSALRLAVWASGLLAVAVLLLVHLYPGVPAPFADGKCRPDVRLFGYSAQSFNAYFADVTDAEKVAFATMLLGVDRVLAVVLSGFLVLWALHLRQWPAMVLGVAYGLSDWFENSVMASLVLGVDGSVPAASALTVSKFATLLIAFGFCLWAVWSGRRAR